MKCDKCGNEKTVLLFSSVCDVCEPSAGPSLIETPDIRVESKPVEPISRPFKRKTAICFPDVPDIEPMLQPVGLSLFQDFHYNDLKTCDELDDPFAPRADTPDFSGGSLTFEGEKAPTKEEFRDTGDVTVEICKLLGLMARNESLMADERSKLYEIFDHVFEAAELLSMSDSMLGEMLVICDQGRIVAPGGEECANSERNGVLSCIKALAEDRSQYLESKYYELDAQILNALEREELEREMRSFVPNAGTELPPMKEPEPCFTMPVGEPESDATQDSFVDKLAIATQVPVEYFKEPEPPPVMENGCIRPKTMEELLRGK